MKAKAGFFDRWYHRLLTLYPSGFYTEFGNEMQEVFTQAISSCQNRWQQTSLFWREIRELPAALLRQYWNDCFHGYQGGSMITQNEFEPPSSKGEALLGALPFLAFGLVSMLGKYDFHIHEAYFFLAFYPLALIGLLVGWIKQFPRWAYSYLGWTLVFAWWWTNMRTNGLTFFGHTFAYNESWDWWSWLALALVALIALAWTRSLRPIKEFFLGIWNDWTRLSFAMFAFPAWVTLIYDENHHPYLLLFMLGSTLTLGIGAYLYLRSRNTAKRMLSLLGSLVAALTFYWICNSTWDFHAFYHLPPTTEPWYMGILRWSAVLIITALFMFGPAILSLLRGRKKQSNA